MKNRAIKLAAIVGSTLLCLSVPTFAQEDVTIDFTGVANPSVQALDAYAGFYTGTVTANGVTTTETPGFICDDYNNEIFLPSESWQATAISFASLVTTQGAGTLFGSTIGLAGYAAIANLASQMAATLTEPLTPQQLEQTQAAIATAIWYIGAINSSNPVSLSQLESVAGAQTLVNSMEDSYGAFGPDSGNSNAIAELEDSSLWLYTPTGQDISGSGIPNGQTPFPQEFVGNAAVLPAPEGGAPLLYLLLAGVSCFGAMYVNSRCKSATSLTV
jgi:hypothetical protein